MTVVHDDRELVHTLYIINKIGVLEGNLARPIVAKENAMLFIGVTVPETNAGDAGLTGAEDIIFYLMMNSIRRYYTFNPSMRALSDINSLPNCGISVGYFDMADDDPSFTLSAIVLPLVSSIQSLS